VQSSERPTVHSSSSNVRDPQERERERERESRGEQGRVEECGGRLDRVGESWKEWGRVGRSGGELDRAGEELERERRNTGHTYKKCVNNSRRARKEWQLPVNFTSLRIQYHF